MPAAAVDQSKGYPGYCKDDKGVTVVVDFGELGGTALVRCNPSTTRGTGLDALKGAGFQIAGTQRWGESFICRIENRPSAQEELPITGNAGYRERCVDTPPTGGYWSYWHAGNNCSWTYSKWGVKNRDFVPGGFEGWSFSLNARTGAGPVPRVAAVRPGTAGQACNAADEPAPSSNDPKQSQQGTGGSQPGGTAPGDDKNSADSTLPAPKPRPLTGDSAPDPSANVEFSGGEDAPDVNQVLKDQSDASDYAPWVAAGVVVLLVLGMWLTGRRRRHARDA
ncbi:MAG: hypothetical protein L0H93_08130 [Nocardioides sp.]|nr:hypothetical protein [Nocardioides sp.]